MTETTCIRVIVLGIILAAIGLLLPERTYEWIRAAPIVVGFVLIILASYKLLRLPKSFDEGERE